MHLTIFSYKLNICYGPQKFQNTLTVHSSFYENFFVVDINLEILGAVQVGLGAGYVNRVLVHRL